jgi:AAA domain
MEARMTTSFRPAVRSNVNLLIGLAGASGSGKTYSALRLASGMANGKRFVVLDTENGRASHYADQFAFDVAEIHEPFTPDAYAEAIKAADDAGYSVIVVDSASHEYAGTGGVLDMQEAEYQRMGGRDSAKMASWIKPKMEHKKMMQRLLQTRAHLILCFRAEAKIEIIKEDGKTKIVPKQSLIGLDGWIPVTEKTVPFELTVSLLLTPDRPGIPHAIKLQEQHKALFPLGKEITEESGRRIAEWAAGGTNNGAKADADPPQTGHAGPETTRAASSPTNDLLGEPAHISVDQVIYLGDQCREHGIDTAKLCDAAKVSGIGGILAADYDRAVKWLNTAIEKRRTAA